MEIKDLIREFEKETGIAYHCDDRRMDECYDRENYCSDENDCWRDNKYHEWLAKKVLESRVNISMSFSREDMKEGLIEKIFSFCNHKHECDIKTEYDAEASKCTCGLDNIKNQLGVEK